MLSEVARAYLTGFRDGTRAASAKPAPADRSETDRSPRVGFQLLISEPDGERDDNDGVVPCHTITIPPQAAA